MTKAATPGKISDFFISFSSVCSSSWNLYLVARIANFIHPTPPSAAKYSDPHMLPASESISSTNLVCCPRQTTAWLDHLDFPRQPQTSLDHWTAQPHRRRLVRA